MGSMVFLSFAGRRCVRVVMGGQRRFYCPVMDFCLHYQLYFPLLEAEMHADHL